MFFYVEHVSRQDFSVVNLLSLPRQPPYMNTSHWDVLSEHSDLITAWTRGAGTATLLEDPPRGAAWWREGGRREGWGVVEVGLLGGREK